MKTTLHILLAASIILSSTVALAELTVDLGQAIGPVTHNASGLLWSVTKDEPSDELIKPLKIKKYRTRLTPWIEGSGLDSFPRMNKLGANIQVCLSGEYALHFKDRKVKEKTKGFGYHQVDVWPGDNGDFSLWDRVIVESFEKVKAAGLTVEWDVWEEPNWHGWWGRDREQFFETYAYFHRRLRKLDPDAVIVGPSINKFDREYLEAFLLFAKKNDVLPDILSWHEIIEQHRPIIIPQWVQTMKTFMKDNDIQVKGIDIGEFCSPKRQTSPGLNAMYLANLEAAGVNGACRACWRDHDGKLFNGWQPMLDGLLTPDLKPRSTWWVFKAYADLSGNSVKVMEGKWIHGIGGVSKENETVQILIGKDEYPPKDRDVVITGFKETPYLLQQGTVRVVAERIPNSGWQELLSPETVMDAIRPVNDDKLSLNFPELAAHDALVIKLVRPDKEANNGLHGTR